MSVEFQKTYDSGITNAAFPPEFLSRFFESAAALVALIIFSPLLLACSILIYISSGAGIFFRQKRVGRGGKTFTLYKFRTMRESAGGLRITAENDARITPVGRFLRRAKIDELPQLYNVWRGDMSFVGPRPEVPEMVDPDNPLWREVLSVRPGITDPVTLEFRNEERLLAEVEDKITFYRETVQPYKLKGYLQYLRTKNRLTDWQIVFRTAKCVVLPSRAPALSEDLLAAAAKSDKGIKEKLSLSPML